MPLIDVSHDETPELWGFGNADRVRTKIWCHRCCITDTLHIFGHGYILIFGAVMLGGIWNSHT